MVAQTGKTLERFSESGSMMGAQSRLALRVAGKKPSLSANVPRLPMPDMNLTTIEGLTAVKDALLAALKEEHWGKAHCQQQDYGRTATCPTCRLIVAIEALLKVQDAQPSKPQKLVVFVPDVYPFADDNLPFRMTQEKIDFQEAMEELEYFLKS